MTTMQPAFLADPADYYVNYDPIMPLSPAAAAAADSPCANPQHLPQQQQQQREQLNFAKNPQACFLLPPSMAAAAAAAATTTAAAAVAAGAAATAIETPPPEDVYAALNDTMELFISGTSVEPAYELRGELGHGKYGRVFLVEDCVQHRLLAVKATYDPNWIATVRHTQARSQQQQQQQQYVAPMVNVMRDGATACHHDSPLTPPASHVSSEVICMRECNSPFIVRLEGAEKGEHGEDLLLMEYVDCGDLRQEIRRRRAIQHPFTEREVAYIFLQLCMAVDHLHQRNILHHDLKPENIMLSSTGVIKLGDFGFARKYAQPVCNRVATTGCGTPYYLSPEALRGETYSLKSEMWALGVILYELMALTGPFQATNRAELRAKVQDGHYALLPSTYARELRDVCAQLLSQRAEDRPSAHELFTENEYLRGQLNELRRTSECSTKMTAEEKGSMFYSISAALRRRTPTTPRGTAAGGSTCHSWASSLDNSSGVSCGAATTAIATQRARLEF